MLDPRMLAELAADMQRERIEKAQEYLHAEPAEPLLPILKAKLNAFAQRWQRNDEPRPAHRTQEIPAVR